MKLLTERVSAKRWRTINAAGSAYPTEATSYIEQTASGATRFEHEAVLRLNHPRDEALSFPFPRRNAHFFGV